MAQKKARGSIIYELLIVVLAVVLVGSIMYPKQVSDREQQNTTVCRQRMSSILDAQYIYLGYNSVYSDTLSKVVDFLRSDQAYATYIDSVIKGGLDSILTRLNEFKSKEQFILSQIPAATDTIMIDSLSVIQQSMKSDARGLAGFVEQVNDRMKNLPGTPTEELKAAFLIIDSKKFTLDMDIVKNQIENGNLPGAQTGATEVIRTIDSVIGQFAHVKDRLPNYKGAALDSLSNCPSVNKPFRLVHIDTSVIKFLNIYCPVDSVDIEAVSLDFLKSKVGGLKLMNHGVVEKGEKSWEST